MAYLFVGFRLACGRFRVDIRRDLLFAASVTGLEAIEVRRRTQNQRRTSNSGRRDKARIHVVLRDQFRRVSRGTQDGDIFSTTDVGVATLFRCGESCTYAGSTLRGIMSKTLMSLTIFPLAASIQIARNSFLVLLPAVSQISFPQTTGEDQPSPGIAVFQRTFFASSNSTGRSLAVETPSPLALGIDSNALNSLALGHPRVEMPAG